MNIIVRFYWQHDLDLVALAMHPDFCINHWLKRSIIAAAREDTGFYIPNPRPQPYKIELSDCTAHFTLNPDTEADVIEFLNGFRYGFRNSVIKMILRQYLEAPFIAPFFNEKMYMVKTRGRAQKKAAPKKAPNLMSLMQKQKNIEQNHYPIDIFHAKPSSNEMATPPSDESIQSDTGAKKENTALQSVPDSGLEMVKIKENIAPSHEKSPSSTTPSSTKPIKTDEIQEELYLGDEENESMQGETFDLFAAVDKLL